MLTAVRLGVDEVILVAADGSLLEANRSSVFAVVEGELVTPRLGDQILAGVTRGALLDAARQAGLSCREGRVESAGPFDEFYLASTLKELAPVASLDGVEGPGAGPVGRALYDAFQELVASER
jgi:branched-chain amino acid aminotransferase